MWLRENTPRLIWQIMGLSKEQVFEHIKSVEKRFQNEQEVTMTDSCYFAEILVLFRENFMVMSLPSFVFRWETMTMLSSKWRSLSWCN